MEAFSLLEVNQYIKRVLALNFEEAFWVECELNQVSNSRGNLYLELIQKADEGEEVVAKNSAQIWYRQHLFIKKKLGKQADAILSPGIKVKMKVNVNYSERYGLSLVVEDIDPSYTFGQFELNRQKIIDKLTEKNLIDKNSKLPLPTVMQKIAVISSSRAAGYKDFVAQLTDNDYGYDFEITLYDSAMQGQKTEQDVVAALIAARKSDADVIVIIRGGGSKLDLSGFDNYNIAFEVAASELPVITGIGHEIDQTITDIVAHSVMKTPTAVADMIIEHNVGFESDVLTLENEIFSEVNYRLQFHSEQLIMMQERIRTLPATTVTLHRQLLANMEESIESLALSKITSAQKEMEMMEEKLELLDPKLVLQRGYTLVRQKGKLITDAALLSKKDIKLDIQFRDGEISVKKITDG